jgi:hypothetical protein
MAPPLLPLARVSLAAAARALLRHLALARRHESLKARVCDAATALLIRHRRHHRLHRRAAGGQPQRLEAAVHLAGVQRAAAVRIKKLKGFLELQPHLGR